MNRGHGPGGSSRRWRRFWVLPVVVGLSVASCTSDDEPGREPETRSSPTAAGPDETTGASPDETTAPEDPAALPVAGSFVVNATDTGAPVRFAVHSVRRVAGGSVLDYSVTALPSDGQVAGDQIDSSAELDFAGFRNAPNVNLVDVPAAQLYRPLADDSGACVCTFVYPPGLVVGETQLHQAAYPTLPDDLSEVTVEFGNGPLLEAVPVLDEGTVPTAEDSVDLAAEAAELLVVASTRDFDYPIATPFIQTAQRQPLRIDVNEVVSGPGGTSLVWTINATASGEGLVDVGTPVTDYRLAPVTVAIKTGVASGPGLRPSDDPAGPVMRSWFATVKAMGDNTFTDVEAGDWRFCLCSDYQFYGDGVNESGESRTFVTHLPPLPEGTTTVDVVFPDDSLPPLTDIAVDEAATSTLGEPEDSSGTAEWSSPEGGLPRDAFTLDDWPIPVPDEASMSSVEPLVDDLLLKESLPAAQREQQKQRVEITLDSTISFQPDSAELTATARDGIADIAAQIDDEVADGSAVSIEGHVAGTDEGSASFQMQLSVDRADAVLAELRPQVKTDVELTAQGFGAERPLVPNDTEANRQLNRRVVVVFTSTDG
ncbi:MAG: OmpA family protein [Nocardioidaceae bacterium]